MSFTSPFGASTCKPGHGSIVLDILPPDNKPVLRTVSYQYPLKLIAPDPLPPPCASSPSRTAAATAAEEDGGAAPTTRLVHTVFLLTYGGGIVAGDQIALEVSLARTTRLILLTQGSTKIFKTADPALLSRQHMTVRLAADSALVYLPDPVQPFAHAAFSQAQTYLLEDGAGSLCVCDWVTSGRAARGENWHLHEYRSRNEVWSCSSNSSSTGTQGKRLLLRDNLVLDQTGRTDLPFSERMDGYAVFGTLIVRGAVFASLGKFFLAEFEALPRIGGRDWGDSAEREVSASEQRRAERVRREQADGLIWSASNVRGFVLVKFASRQVEGSRNWLRDMIREEASVLEAFGERATLCLK